MAGIKQQKPIFLLNGTPDHSTITGRPLVVDTQQALGAGGFDGYQKVTERERPCPLTEISGEILST